MLPLSLSLLAFSLISPGVIAQTKKLGEPCDINRNRLTSATHQFLSDCERKYFCDPVEFVCKPKGCRSEEFPFGFRPEDTLPPFCPDGSFCPDEEDICIPTLKTGEHCQMNRDDQCEPAPNAAEIASPLNHKGAICLQFTCYWANATIGETCVVDNTVFAGYREDGTEFATVISRDNCKSPESWCNAKTLQCERALEVGEACEADKMCKTYHCGLNNQCQEPVGSELKISLWQYIVTGAGIVAFILAILLSLFFIHKRDRALKLKEYKEYYHEQNTYRQSIISLHNTARDRVSIYSASSSRFSQYDEHGQLVYSDDASQRHLLGNGRRQSGLRTSMVFDDESDSDEDRAQGKKLLSGENYASSSRDTPRQSVDHGDRESFDYSQPAMGSAPGGYGAVPTRESMDLPYGASAPRRGEFKDPWSK